MNFTPGNYLIELMGRSRMVAELSVCNCGGFLAEEIDRSGNRASPVYIGSLAIYRMWPCSEEVAVATAARLGDVAGSRMWPCSEEVAVATAARLGDVAGSLPEWAVKPAPPKEPPQPKPDDQIGILSPGGGAIDVTFVGYLNGVPHVRVGHTLNPLTQSPRWIRRNNVTIWEQEPGQYERDTDDIPF